MNFNIETIKRKMLVKYPFFGSIVSNVEYQEMKEIGTAATDGKKIYYNPSFMDKLSVDEQIFILAHEVCHIAFNHILRSEKKNPKLWNIATDAVINAFLKNDGLKMVDGGVLIEDAINYNAEQLYEKLLKEQKNQGDTNGMKQDGGSQQGQSGSSSDSSSGSSNGSSDNNENSSQDGNSSKTENNETENQNQNGNGSDNSNNQEENNDVGHDTHSMWADAIKKNKEEKNKKNNEGKNQKDGNSSKDENNQTENQNQNGSGNSNNQEENNDESKNKSELEKKQEEMESLGERDAFKKNIEEKKRQLEKLKRELTRQAMGAGNQAGNSIRNVSDIGRSKPLIDWRYVLRETTKYDVDWSYQNATIEDGVVSAHLEEQPIPETEIVLDTSGSINETLLKNFLRECKNILKHSRLKVGCFDTRFYGFHEIRSAKDIDDMKFVGGGGTNFEVAVNAFSKRVDNKIIFTDGDAIMPNSSINAIWIVFGYRKINPKGGKVIYITGEDLRKLTSYSIEENYKGKTI